ncbi:MAG: hypothetical protein ACYTFF_18855, partial [Planctomycetota bacterium]
AAIQEWEAQADRQVSYGINGEPYSQGEQYEIRHNEVADDYEATQWLFGIVSRPSSVKQILAQVDPDFVESKDFNVPNTSTFLATFEFSDAWGNPIVAVFPGRTWADSFDPIDDRDQDGTLRTPLEKLCGVATPPTARSASSQPAPMASSAT